MNRKILLNALSLVLFFIVFHSCEKSTDSVLETPDNVSTSISGRVLGPDKNPVKGATVMAGSTIVITDMNGVFTLSNIAVSKNNAYIKVQKDGYYTGSRTFVANENTTNNISIELIPKIVSGTFIGSSGGSVSVASGGSIVFPANGVINSATNTSYTGSVSVSASFLNPTVPDFSSKMPGDLRGITKNNEEKGLQSFGMMAVELNGSAGEKLQLAPDKNATITFPIPASMHATAPATISLWYFDEVKGIWKEEGIAQKQGNNYVGTVTHFSFWNYSVPYQLVDFEAEIKDANGNALSGANVLIRTTIDTSMSRSALTDSKGRISGLIPANKVLNLFIYNKCNILVYSRNIGPFNNNTNLGDIVTAATGGTILISGKVNNCNNSPVTNGYVNVTISGVNHRADVSNGTFNITIPSCTAGYFSATISSYDITANVQGTPTIINGTTGTTTTIDLIACGTTANEYINYTVGNTSHAFVSPSHRFSAVYYLSETSIWASNEVSGNIEKTIRFRFDGNTTGTKTINRLDIVHGDLRLIKNGTLTVNISQYGNFNEYIIGSFSGSAIDSITTNTYPITCNFKVRR